MQIYKPLADVLVADAAGQLTNRYLRGQSCDWDEITSVTDSVYMPFRVRPVGKSIRPKSTHHTTQIGGFTVSRFSYGVPVYIDNFDPAPGKGMVLTTLFGDIQHAGGHVETVQTGAGESFWADTAKADYVFEAFNGHHMQLNLVYRHQMLEDLYERWNGRPADPGMWTQRFKFGGPGSSWNALLEYSCRCIVEMPDQMSQGVLGKHLEEMLGLHLIRQLQCAFGETNESSHGVLAPRCVKAAEDYMASHARFAPNRTQVAAAVGVSVRALSASFARFRGHSPMAYLRKVRLQGVRADLLAAPAGASVREIAAAWGYIFLGDFARQYRQQFGELPSETLRRLRS